MANRLRMGVAFSFDGLVTDVRPMLKCVLANGGGAPNVESATRFEMETR